MLSWLIAFSCCVGFYVYVLCFIDYKKPKKPLYVTQLKHLSPFTMLCQATLTCENPILHSKV